MIKTIIFDLSGVFFNNGLAEAAKKISTLTKLSPQQIEEILDGKAAEGYRTGTLSPEEFWENAQKEFNVKSCDDVKNSFFNAYHIKQETVDLIHSLKKQGLNIAYVSNAPPDRTEYLEKKFHFLQNFDSGVFSFEAGARKPSKEIFKYLLKKNRFVATECVYIDDKKSNLAPAREMGMVCIHFVTVGQTKKELQQLGIL